MSLINTNMTVVEEEEHHETERTVNEEVAELPEEEENDEESDDEDEEEEEEEEDTLQEKLLDAAREGDHTLIGKLVADEGAELLDALEEGWSPLHWLAAEGAADAIAVLVAVGANAAVRGADGETALHLAALNGHARACTALVGGTATQDEAAAADAPIDQKRAALLEARDSRGWRALHLAAAAGRGRSARALLLAGADARACVVDEEIEAVGDDAATCAQSKGHDALASCLKAAAGSRGAGSAHEAWQRAARADGAASIAGLAAAASSATVTASPLARLLAALPEDVVAGHMTSMWLDTCRGKWLTAVWPRAEGDEEDDVDESEEAVAAEIDAAASVALPEMTAPTAVSK